MGLIQLYSTPKTNSTVTDATEIGRMRCLTETPSFCRCQRTDAQRKPIEKTKPKCQINLLPDRCTTPRVYLDAPRTDKNRLQIPQDTCQCGEDICRRIDWTWDKQMMQPHTIVNNHTVQFHPIYSQGTSVIRSDRPLTPNMIHYWEIKIVHWLSGTDLVIKIQNKHLFLKQNCYFFRIGCAFERICNCY